MGAHLPEQLTSFVGRHSDLTALRSMAAESRLITMIGPGGVGKSRLAIRLAQSLSPRFHDGVWWVDLAPIDDPGQVPAAIASSLGLRSSGDASTDIIWFMKDKNALLMFDNCEHVVDACAHFARQALEQCPTLAIIATSQEALGVPGEAVWQVKPMTDRDAVELFAQRARLVQPGFEIDASNAAPVGEICRQVDQLPLAIELAASKLGVMTETEISHQLAASLDVLTGGPRTEIRRHQTVAATIEWSYSQLSEDEQVLFRRLAVFRGGFSLESATAVCRDAQVPDVLSSLTRLVGRSMVAAHRLDDASTRYRLLELHQAFAERESSRFPAEWGATQRRHYDYFLAGLTSRTRRVPGRGSALGVTLADEKWKRLELVNLWSAFRWARRNCDDRGLSLAPDILLIDYTDIRTARSLLNDLLTESNVDVGTRLWVMDVNALLAQYQGDYSELERLSRSIESLARKENDAEWIAKGLNDIAATHLVLGEIQEGESAVIEGLRLARATSNTRLIATLENLLGYVLLLRGDNEGARVQLTNCIASLKAIDDAWFLAIFMDSLAVAELACGDYAAAESTWQEAISLISQLGDYRTAVYCLAGVACTANARGDHARCLRLAGAHHALAAQWSIAVDASVLTRLTQCEETSRNILGAKRSDEALDAGARMSLNRAIEYACEQEEGISPLPKVLSRREAEVASLVAQGMTNRAIAAKLFLSERTVEGHLDRIRTKLDLRTRSELAAWAARHDS